MRPHFILFLLLFLAAEVSAQARAYSTAEIVHIGDSVIRARYPSRVVDGYLKFIQGESRIYKRIDSVYTDPLNGRERLWSNHIYISLRDDTTVAPPFVASYMYEISLPEQRNATMKEFFHIQFDTGRLVATPFNVENTIGGLVIVGVSYRVKELHAAYSEMYERGKKIMQQALGEETYHKGVTILESAHTGYTRIYPSGGYFVTPTRDTFIIPFAYSLQYSIHPIDNDSAFIFLQISLDKDLQVLDTAKFRRDIQSVPGYIRTAKPSGIISRDSAFSRAFALGLPKPLFPPPRYANKIIWDGKRFTWDLFTTQTFTSQSDMLNHSCAHWGGQRMILDAITGALIKQYADGYTEGCERSLAE